MQIYFQPVIQVLNLDMVRRLAEKISKQDLPATGMDTECLQ
jgi:hypothetical protein